MSKLLVSCCVALMLFTGPGAGLTDQEEEQSRPQAIGGLTFVDEYELTVVNVNVHVTDKKGRPITDLTRDDFTIYQDGDLKPITNFALYTKDVIESYYAQVEEPKLGPTPVPEAEALDDPRLPAPRPTYVVLYVDNENIRPLERNHVLRDVRDWVRDNLTPPVQMMVVSYERSLKIKQNFTTDPDLILEALRGMRKQTGGRTQIDSSRLEVLDDLERSRDDGGTSTRNSQSRGGYQTVLRRIRSFADEESNGLMFTMDALREAVSMLAGMPGKKSIVYISNGLPMVPGIDLFYEFSSVYRDSSTLTLISQYDKTRLFQSLAQSANAQGVNFYTIGAGGLEIGGMGSAERGSPRDPMSSSIGMNNYLDSMRYMADRTGGLAILNTNDFSPGLDRIAGDIFTYYSLGYALVQTGADKVHNIKVTVPEYPDYKVRYRRRFVEKSIESRVQDSVVSGLVFEVDQNPMHLRFDSGNPAPAAEGRWLLPVNLSFPLSKVALVPQGEDYVGRVVLFIAARDTKGKQSDLVRQEHEIRVPASGYEESGRQHFGIDANLLMESGSYSISVGMLDLVTRQSSYTNIKTTVGGG